MQYTMILHRHLDMLDIPLKIVSAFEQMNYYVHATVLFTVLTDLFKSRFSVSK